MAIASLVLGIIASLMSFLGGYIGMIDGGIIGLIGTVFGIMCLKRHEREGVAVAGIVCSILGLTIFALFILLTELPGFFM